MDKIELIRKIKEYEGLSNDEKTVLLNLLHQKKYGLVWEEIKENIEAHLSENLPVLKEVHEEKIDSLISKDSGVPNHIIIEGDNLAALIELSYTHKEKIDVIYIDPPYNTGKEFIYNDDIIDSENQYKHSKWAYFMHERIKKVRGLLKPTGLLFISIDFHEMHNLILICNEIFGEANFVANVTIKGNPRGRQSSSYFAQVDDALLVYRNSSEAILQGFQISDETAKKRFNKIDENGEAFEEWELRKRGADSRRVDSPKLWFPIYWSRKTNQISTSPIDESDIVVTPKLSSGEDGRWRWSKEKVEREKDSLYIRATRSGYNVFERKYPEGKSRQLPPTIWDYPEVNTELGTKLLKDILGNNVPFEYPKPLGLITRILELIPNKNAVVLDFFAGSGTTLHATMQLNAEDGGHRTCILCTNNENNICEDITYERNKRVIEGYTTPKGEEVEGLHDNNLRYYRTEFIPRERTVENMRKLMNASTGLLCIKNDLYTEAPFGGRKIKAEYARYFEKDEKRMLIIYDERAIPVIVNIIKGMPKGEEKIKVYIFSHGSYAYNDEFEEVEDKVALIALPQAIYDAYKNALPPQKIKYIDEERDDEEMEDNVSDPQMSLDSYFEEDMISEKGGEE